MADLDPIFLHARIVELEGIVRHCGEQFRFYEASHREQAVPLADADPRFADKMNKAEVNRNFASRCEAALKGTTAFLPADTAPEQAENLLVAVIIECCAPGTRMVITGGRLDGRWAFGLEHDFAVIGWMHAPRFPEILVPENRQ